MIIAVDVGYGYTKAVSGDRRISFPSLVAPYEPSPFRGSDLDQDSRLQYKVSIKSSFLTGEKVVGEAAKNSSMVERLVGDEKNQRVHDILLLTAVALLIEGKPDEKIDLAVGLPLQYYASQKSNLYSRLSCLTAQVSLGKEERRISFNSVKVLPQGYGAIMASDIDFPNDGMVGVIDIGTYTTDFVLLEVSNGFMKPINECCRSATIGIEQIYQQVAAEFNRQTGAVVPPGLIHQVINKTAKGEPVSYAGKKHNLHPAYKRAIDEVASAILGVIQSTWSARSQFLDATILAGGGAEYFYGLLNGTLPNLTKISNPVYANCTGYLRILEQMTKRKVAN